MMREVRVIDSGRPKGRFAEKNLWISGRLSELAYCIPIEYRRHFSC